MRRREEPVPLTGKSDWYVDHRANVLRDFGLSTSFDKRDSLEPTKTTASVVDDPKDVPPTKNKERDVRVAFVHICMIVFSSSCAIQYVESKGIFDHVGSWQITILTMVVAPVIAAKHFARVHVGSNGDMASLLVLGIFWAASGWKRTTWVCGIGIVVLLVHFVHKIWTRRTENILIVLNVIIPPGFWIGVLVNGILLDGKTFCHVDRGIRKYGFLSSWREGEMQITYARELWFHFLGQYLILWWFLTARRSRPDLWSRRGQIVKDGMLALSCWIFLVSMFSPDRMPYPPLDPVMTRTSGCALVVAWVLFVSHS